MFFSSLATLVRRSAIAHRLPSRHAAAAFSTSAQALVFQGPGLPFLHETCDLPPLNDGEVLVKLEMATICGSDLHSIDGKRIEPAPSVLGHEGVGVVQQAAPGARAAVGDRVTFTVADSCGTCRPCGEYHLPQKCTSLFKYGHALMEKDPAKANGLNGTYASHIVLKKGTAMIPIPDNVSNKVAAPANCALATMVEALFMAPLPVPTENVLIQGAGLLGLYGSAMLDHEGAKVWCTDLNQKRLDMVPKFGGIAAPIDPAEAEAAIMADPAVQANRGVDLVVEVAGAPAVLPQGIRLLRPGGMYVLVGMVHPDSGLGGVTGEQLIRKCVTMRGIHNYSPEALQRGVDFLSATVDKYPFEDLVHDKVYPLSDLAAAVDLARTQIAPRVAVDCSL